MIPIDGCEVILSVWINGPVMTLPCRRTRLRCQPSTKHEDSAFVTLLRKGEQASVDLGIDLDAAEQGGREKERRVRDGVVAVETVKSIIARPSLCKSIKVVTETSTVVGGTCQIAIGYLPA